MLPKEQQQPKQSLKQRITTWAQRERQLIIKSFGVAAFLLLQLAILYITATLQMLGANFFLSVFVCLELLFGIVVFFWPSEAEREIKQTCYDIGMLITSGDNMTHHQLDVILSLLQDSQQVQEHTDTRLAILKDLLEHMALPKTKGKVRPLVNGTSQQLPIVNDPATAATADHA